MLGSADGEMLAVNNVRREQARSGTGGVGCCIRLQEGLDTVLYTNFQSSKMLTRPGVLQ